MIPIGELQTCYRNGDQTPLQMMQELLQKLETYPDPAVWISRKAAAQLLAEAAALGPTPDPARPLWGIPFAVKDNIDAAGLPTTAGCPDYAYQPTANAHAVQRLLDAGALLIGKTNLDQFATGLNGTRSPYGAPRCVFDQNYISGGSSSGSAVAVAAGLVSFALGTDTAGSGRVPAAFNNIVGLKPTRGTVSNSGLVPACRSLDCITVFAATVGEADAVFTIMRGFDPADPFARPPQDLPLPGPLRVGVLGEPREFFGDQGAADLYSRAIACWQDLGATIVPIDYAPLRQAAAMLYEGAFVAERQASIGAFAATHPTAIDPAVARILAGADRFTAADAFADLYRQQAYLRHMQDLWQQISFLLLPTAPTCYSVAAMQADPLALNARLGLYTNFVNLLDCAAIAVPAGFGSCGHLPFGVTLIGPAFTDKALAHQADRFHAHPEAPALPPPPDGRLTIAVAGAHLSGQPLNHQLITAGGWLVATTRSAPAYRLYALAGTTPPKPGLVFDPETAGEAIELELWSLSAAAFAHFVAAVPPPMVIGKVRLEDGSQIPGFLCEPAALRGAEDITHFRGWRAYLASSKKHQ